MTKVCIKLSRLALAIVFSLALVAPVFFTGTASYAAGTYFEIVEPGDGATIVLDYSEFNIKTHYYVDTYENRGSIYFYISKGSETMELDEGYIQAYSSANKYPHEYTAERRVWVPDQFTGSCTIKAEYWNWKLKPGTASEWINNELIATYQVNVFIAPEESGITPVPDPTPVTPPVSTTTPDVDPLDIPPPPGIDPGAIYVYSNPGNAEIWINGQYTVNTNSSPDNPFGFTDLAPATYTVTIRKEGFQDYTEVVNLNPNEIYDVRAVLQPGVTATGWIQINTDPADVKVVLNNKQVAVAPILLTDVPPGSYDLRLKKDGYDDWYDTITVNAGQITEVNAALPLASGGFPVGPVAGGAAAVVVGGTLIKVLSGRGKGAAVKTPPQTSHDLYKEWWDKASPDDRNNWNSFEKFLTSRLGAPRLNNYINEYGQPSWASAHTSWQQEVSKGETKASFEEWVKAHSANQDIVKEMQARAEKYKNVRPKDLVEASEKYSEALRNKERFERLTTLKKIVSNDSRLSEFAQDASNIIVKDGIVDANKLNRLEGTLKYWIVRDKLMPQTPDYTQLDAAYDTVNQASKNIVIRAGAFYLSGGYSEMVLNPISAVSTMRQSIMEGKSTTEAVTDGFKQASFELALGESGRLVKYAQPYLTKAKDTYNLSKLSKLDPNLSSEVSTINQLANQADDAARYSRDAFMKRTDLTKVGQTTAANMDEAERLAMQLNNNPEFRKMMAENSSLIPSKVKDVMGIAKQKAYQNARNSAIDDVMGQMGKEGVPTGENPFFIKQTGTHAQPGNPGWNSVKSDFDHTVEFGSSKYNQLYEQRFNTHLEAQGTSATAMDANVYGPGTSSRGSYTGGAKKFVEHYNETSGSDIMIRSEKGATVISRETPQTSTSLLSKMKPDDVKSATQNYQNFFKKDMAKGGSLENQIVNGSKTVSREAGQYSNQYADNFLKTGKVTNYQPHPAAKVADLIKKQGYSVNDAMKKAGYTGSKEQLLADYKKIMGVD